MTADQVLGERVAIVTGGGRGIGRAIALALGAQGAAVVVVARTQSEVDETAAMLRQRGVRAAAIALDVGDWRSARQMVDRTIGQFGGVDILISNAGVQGPIGPMAESDPEEWARTIQTNLLGVFHCCRAVLPHMISRRHGKIVNLSGGGATAPRPRFSAYAASKAAVVRLTETLADEVRPYNIQVNAIGPGSVDTQMLAEIVQAGPAAGPTAAAAAMRQKELGGEPPELAAALALFLSSPAADGLTGKLIIVPHDAWQDWDEVQIERLMSTSWYTLRRIDPYTVRQLLEARMWPHGSEGGPRDRPSPAR